MRSNEIAKQFVKQEGIKMSYDKNSIDADAEREGAALEQQGRYTPSRYRWIRLQEEHKRAIEKKHFRE